MSKKFISDDMALLNEWDYEKNKNIDPSKIAVFSNKKFWWKCENGFKDHSYQAFVSDKYRDRTGCPYCSNRKVLKGFNDLATTRPDLIDDWDFEHNEKSPYEITAGSSYKANWICHKCGYKWPAIVSSRSKGNGCRECAKKTRVETASKLRIKKRGSLADKYPELLLDYDYKNNPAPETLSSGSKIKVHWICHKCNYDWWAPVYSRTTGNNGCSKCAKEKFKEHINAKNAERVGSLAEKYPELLEEWNYENNQLDPTNIPYTSHQIVSWKCSKCGRIWNNSIRNRTIHNQGCTCEVGETISKKVKESYLNRNGSLKDNLPVILKEWDYEKNSQIGLDPDSVSPYSQQEAYWHCPRCGHEWKQKIAEKTFNLALCPKCSRESKTSFPEQTVYYYLKQCTTALNRERKYGYEIDIFLPELNIGIEYDGMRFHKGRKLEFDQKKDAALLSKGIRIIRIKEYKSIKPTTPYNVDINDYFVTLTTTLNKLLSEFGFSADIDIKRDEQRIYEQYVSLPKTNSLAIKYPQIAKEWNQKKNGRITPETISYGSKKTFWWTCSNCGKEYPASVQSRTIGHGGHCPNCWVKKKGRRPKKKLNSHSTSEYAFVSKLTPV